MLEIDRAHLLTCRDGELIAVNDDANRYAVHFGNTAADRLGAHRLRVPKQRGNHCGKHEGTAPAEDVSPVQILMSFY